MPVLFLVVLLMASAALVRAATVPDTPFHLPYAEITQWIEDDPSPVATVVEFGNSRDGRALKAIVVSDHPTVNEDEPVLLFTGVIHGREVLGARVVLELVETLTEGYGVDPAITEWVDAYQIWVVPVMNPWGYDHQRRKNAATTPDPATSGVDLNRNFDFRWGRCCDDPMDDDYFGGPSSMSEPESQSMRNLILELRPMFGITFHSGQGGPVGKILYPWGTGDDGDDGIPGNCDDLFVSAPVDKQEGKALAEVLLNAVTASRNRPGGRLCNGSSDIAGACDDSDFGVFSSLGASSAYYHALTGMFDFEIETNGDLDGDECFTSAEAWRNDYFYEVNPTLTAEEQSHFDDAVEYTRNYLDGILALLDHFLCQTTPEVRYTGPGVTGQVFDHGGNPLPAVVKVLERDITLDVDFEDTDCDGVPDVPHGGTDLMDRRANVQHGRYYRLLDKGTYTLEFSLPGYPSVVRSVMVSGPCLTDVTVALQSPPMADAGEDQVVECQGDGATFVTLDGSGSTDPDSTTGNDDIILFEWIEDFGAPWEQLLDTGEMATVELGLGAHTITLRVTDSWGQTDTDKVVVTVEDTTPPEITVTLDTDVLWPPNHKMVQIRALVEVSDSCDPGPTWTIVGASSDEPDNGRGDGNTVDDIQGVSIGTADTEFSVRAERQELGDGRKYTFTFLARDASGNTTETEVCVIVPH